ncbi:MAG: KEOPS complex subunit Cgi121 [Methanobacteriota archaeon]
MITEDEIDILVRQIRVTISDIPAFLTELRQIGVKHQCTLICFNHEVMAGRRHVLSAVIHAKRAFAEGQEISRTLEVESLLYAAGTRQTGLIGAFGIHTGLNECYFCIVPARYEVYDEFSEKVEDAGNEDWEVIEPDKKRHLCQIFGITNAELAITGREQLQDLILERVALLVVNH